MESPCAWQMRAPAPRLRHRGKPLSTPRLQPANPPPRRNTQSSRVRRTGGLPEHRKTLESAQRADPELKGDPLPRVRSHLRPDAPKLACEDGPYGPAAHTHNRVTLR